MKLNQIIAIEKSVKNRVNEQLTEAYKKLQKPELFTGHIRTYTPITDDPTSKFAEKLPEERRSLVV